MSEKIDLNIGQGITPSDHDIVVVSGPVISRSMLQLDDAPIVVIEGNSSCEDEHVPETLYDNPYAIDRPGFQITLQRDEDIENRINDFDKYVRQENAKREHRRRSGFDAAAAATFAAAMSVSSHRRQEHYRWTQKSIYTPPEPDHEAHMSAAELKRKRKAEMRQKIADKNQGKDA